MIAATQPGARHRHPGQPASFARPPAPGRLWLSLQDAQTAERLLGRVCRAGESLAPGVVAPMSGRIEEVEAVRTLGGRVGVAARLAVDPPPDPHPLDPSRSFDRAMADLERLGPTDLPIWTARLIEAAVEADRWTSPNLTRQLHAAASTPIRAVVCSAVDVAPELSLNGALLRDSPAEAVAGAALLGRLVGAAVWLVVDDATPTQPLEAARDAARLARIRIVTVSADFPHSHPALLMRRIMNVAYSVGQLPTNAGVLWLDTAAAAAVGSNLLHDSPATHSPVVFYDGRAGRPRRVIVPRGTRLRDLLASLETSFVGMALSAGGPLRDRRVSPDDVVDADELSICSLPSPPTVAAAPCVRCGECIDGCPVRIDPIGILDAAQRSDVGRANQLGLAACVECGVCSFVCPSQLPLLQTIRSLRTMTEA